MNSDPRRFGVQHPGAERIPGGARTGTDLGLDKLQRRQLLEVVSNDSLYHIIYFLGLYLFVTVPPCTGQGWEPTILYLSTVVCTFFT